MNIIKLDNIDCLSGNNHYITIFKDINECINICKNLKLNVFIIYNNNVYYRKQSIKECVFNLTHNEKSTMYILLDDINYYHHHEIDRVKYYTYGIYYKKDKYKLTYNKNKLYEILNSDEKTRWSEWFKQHYTNMIKFMNDNNFDFNFNINPYDLSYGQDLPTFVKSRSRIERKLSILLPLENLYIPDYYKYVLKEDIPFNNKIKSCVWRGANSGPFYKNDFKHDHIRASRRELILKFGKNEKYNIGLAYNSYKNNLDRPLDYNIDEYIKGSLNTNEMLKYMFILSVEGNDFSTGLAWIMLSNSVPIMPICFVETWKLETKLLPYVHYIPIENDYSDLDEQIEWGIKNLDKCYEIAYMSKMYVLQFFDKNKENKIIKEVLEIYKNNVEDDHSYIEIKDLNNNMVDIATIEKQEQDLVNLYIKKNDIVLELGARYGSVSCTINKKLQTKTNQVVVEPDDRVWEALEKNKSRNNCDFHIIKGFISNKKLDLTNLDVYLDGYGSTSIENENSKIPSFTLDEINKKYNLNFNVLVADCEGFLEQFFDENPTFYDNIRLLIFEADYPDKCNYTKIRTTLLEKNFRKLL
jgi:FkbM family methyltransferase